jgi:hypothetical protein
MSDDKGKGRAYHDKDANGTRPDEPPPQDPSLVSRVAGSASGLARSAFARPSGNELSESTAAALANAGKGQSSSTGPGGSSAWTESSRASQQPIYQASASNAFRAGHSEEHARQAENEFSSFLDGIDPFTPSQNLGDIHSGGLGGGFGEVWARSQRTGDAISSRPVGYRTVAEQESHDGEEVLSILSAPGDTNDPFEAPPEDDEDYDWGLSQEQVTQLRAMTKDILPPPEPHIPISPEHPLNLVPNFEGTDLGGTAVTSQMHPGIDGQQLAAREAWREQWGDVLTRYTDEVWGGLLPLVKEARREVEELQSSEPAAGQTKAIRRLGAILGHLQKK